MVEIVPAGCRAAVVIDVHRVEEVVHQALEVLEGVLLLCEVATDHRQHAPVLQAEVVGAEQRPVVPLALHFEDDVRMVAFAFKYIHICIYGIK